MITLPTNIKCKVIKLNDLEEVSCNFLRNKVDLNNRYTCLAYDKEVKCYAMILSKEAVRSEKVMQEIKENLARDIFILKQL